jgi:hypothetical protein
VNFIKLHKSFVIHHGDPNSLCLTNTHHYQLCCFGFVVAQSKHPNRLRKDSLKEIREWLSQRSILVPTISVFLLPILTAYLTLNPAPENLKLVLPLITFIAGQSLGKYDKQKEIRNKQLEILLILRRKFSVARKKISSNKGILQLELTSIDSEERGFIEKRLHFLDAVGEEFSRLDTFLDLTKDGLLSVDDLLNFQEIVALIEEFNELVEDRREYRMKCRELTTSSADQYFCLLKHTDEELLKLANSFEQKVDAVSKIDVGL